MFGLEPGIFATIFFMATLPTGVEAWKSCVSTAQPKLFSWPMM
jgi:hypothetical protein